MIPDTQDVIAMPVDMVSIASAYVFCPGCRRAAHFLDNLIIHSGDCDSDILCLLYWKQPNVEATLVISRNARDTIRVPTAFWSAVVAGYQSSYHHPFTNRHESRRSRRY